MLQAWVHKKTWASIIRSSFARGGLAAVVFDCPYFGGSAGDPGSGCPLPDMCRTGWLRWLLCSSSSATRWMSDACVSGHLLAGGHVLTTAHQTPGITASVITGEVPRTCSQVPNGHVQQQQMGPVGLVECMERVVLTLQQGCAALLSHAWRSRSSLGLMGSSQDKHSSVYSKRCL